MLLVVSIIEYTALAAHNIDINLIIINCIILILVHNKLTAFLNSASALIFSILSFRFLIFFSSF